MKPAVAVELPNTLNDLSEIGLKPQKYLNSTVFGQDIINGTSIIVFILI